MAIMAKLSGNARPDSMSYNMMIGALCKIPTKELEEKAVGHLRNMLKSYRDGYKKARPDSFSFNCIISMLARSESGEATNVIYRTLMAMENQRKRGNESIVLDTITYNTVLGKLAKSGSKEDTKKAMTLLENMEEKSSMGNTAITPDIMTYTIILRIQEKVGNTRSAANIASSYLVRAMSKDEKLYVDRFGLKTLLLALSKSRDLEHARTARRAWEQIEKQQSNAGEGRGGVKCHNGDADLLLDSDLCNLVLLAYGRASENGSMENSQAIADEALSFLSQRIRQHSEGGVSAILPILPTVVGFSAVLASLGQGNMADDALRLLRIMRALGEDHAVPNIEPDDGCYISIMVGLARSRTEDAAPQALKVIRRMKEDSGTVSTAALNAAINSCARTVGSPIARRRAIEVAFEMFRFGREGKSCVDVVTYGLMIRTCIELTDDDGVRFRLVEVSWLQSVFILSLVICVYCTHAIIAFVCVLVDMACIMYSRYYFNKPLFKLCAKSGLVGDMVVKEVKHFKKRLVGDRQLLPVGWTMNVNDK